MRQYICETNATVSFSETDYNGSEAVARRCSVKIMFLEIWQISQENTCVRVSFLIKLQTSGLHNFIKKTLAQVLLRNL